MVVAATALLLSRPARAVELRFNPTLMGQVRDDYFSGQTQTPTEIYGDLGLSRMPWNSTLDTYFRVKEYEEPRREKLLAAARDLIASTGDARG